MGENPLGRVVLGDNRLLLEDCDPIAHLDRLVDIMGDEHDRLLELFLEPEELVLEPVASDRVDRSERLVHQQDLGISAERPCHANPLSLTARELAGIPIPIDVRVHPHGVEELVHPITGLLRVPSEEIRNGRDVLGDRAVGEQPDLLDHVSHASSELVRIDVGHVLSVEDDATRRRLDHPIDESEGRRLPAPRGADENEDFASVDVEREICHCRDIVPG